MRTVFKYQLEIVDHQIIKVPSVWRALSVAEQDGKLCIWFQVDSEHAKEDVLVHIVGTGNLVPTDAGLYIGTVVIDQLVWHVYV